MEEKHWHIFHKLNSPLFKGVIRPQVVEDRPRTWPAVARTNENGTSMVPPSMSSTQRFLEPDLTDLWKDVPCHLEAIQWIAQSIPAIHGCGNELSRGQSSRPP
ncbi:hypothetical protein IEQ34_011154 [Dendrobium chrysotoxum]|uniref:Uncharacterized protein n=1 Tax=Dendrobium chrysotoxum TaxID=161865 RepID=A0AAV7GWR4_DENCH|nr:hypothetical protein IEQ34_011154 [Dendrobium chrysotoxum]